MEIPFATFPAGPEEKDVEHRECNRVAQAVAPGAAPAEIRRAAPSFGAWLLLAFLRFYIIFLSPVFGGACKFYPSCSNYAIEAVTKHGAQRGFLLAAKRLLRCRPFTQGGFDPVPDDLPHSKQPNFAEEKARVFTEIDSRIQRTERRIL
ncbi:MAG TPA: membrane protein insertion efficiency factor YidD [Candidatus Acidoferrales bacterium]|nr:membrane protein insertion efficiency factor YidD [Candidatus Acidoferrales bacterium]